MDQFKQLKPSIDNVILRGSYTIPSCKESPDSTSKKLIYQVPFHDVQKISALLKDIEANFQA